MFRFLWKILRGEQLTPEDKARMRTDAMLSRLKYQSLIKKGLSKEEALRRSRY